MTIQTIDYNAEERNTQRVLKCHLYDKCQLAKLLSYHPTTAVQLHMEGGKVVDGFHHLVFHSVASNVMNWPFFLTFVTIDNDDKEDGNYN